MIVNLEHLLPILKSVFGFDDLRELQKPIVQSVINGKDTLAILKTSGGKSLCYQLPALYRQGTTLVVSPLISLMKDQVDSLEALGVHASFVNSSLQSTDIQKRYEKLAAGGYSLFYVSPERFSDEGFIRAIARSPLNMVAVDEAHCASQWGHDFRPNYAKLGRNLDELETVMGRRVQRVAFTATANAKVQADIVTMLKLREPDVHIQDFDRENLSYAVVMSRKNDRSEDIAQAIEEHPGDCTIVYCVTVREVERLYNILKLRFEHVDRYHGRLEPEHKTKVQDDFTSGKTRILISTSAFGMGVDKSDVRLVLHAQMPGSLEAWYQEAGRGGRDGKPSKAILFFHEADKSIHRYFINNSCPTSDKVEIIKDCLYRLLCHGPTQLDPARIAITCRHQSSIIKKAMSDTGIKSTQITREDVAATINLMKNQGEIDHFEGMYAVGRWDDTYNYDWVDEVKKHNWVKFNAMCSWCETNLCRRWQILRYFDERKPHYRCGNCDNCQREALYQINNKALEKTVRPSTLMSLARAIDSIALNDEARWRHVVLGTIPTDHLEAHEVEHSGRFAWHALGDLERWKAMLIRTEMLSESLTMTDKGHQWVDGKLKVEFVPQVTSIPVATVSQVEIDARTKALRAWRKSTAYRQDVSPMTLITEAQLKKIANLPAIQTLRSEQSGFSAKWIDQYADTIIKLIQSLENNNDLSF